MPAHAAAKSATGTAGLVSSSSAAWRAFDAAKIAAAPRAAARSAS
jgi:hypothetical protein